MRRYISLASLGVHGAQVEQSLQQFASLKDMTLIQNGERAEWMLQAKCFDKKNQRKRLQIAIRPCFQMEGIACGGYMHVTCVPKFDIRKSASIVQTPRSFRVYGSTLPFNRLFIQEVIDGKEMERMLEVWMLVPNVGGNLVERIDGETACYWEW